MPEAGGDDKTVEWITFSLDEELERIDPGFKSRKYPCYIFGGGKVKIMSKDDPYDPNEEQEIRS